MSGSFRPQRGTDFLIFGIGDDATGGEGGGTTLSDWSFSYTAGDLTEMTHVTSGNTIDFTYTAGDLTQMVNNVTGITYDFSYTAGDLTLIEAS
ncbi:MAG: hypothetical protein KJN71_09535 [Acidimicrobiia bacterium]|nr:hypothetical protein [Acidimicrobiia bacterium]